MHATSAHEFETIRREGLRTKFPGSYDSPAAIGSSEKEILCLSPRLLQPDYWVGKISSEYPRMLLALRSTSLPETNSVDWSFPDAVNQAVMESEDEVLITATQIVARASSVACLQGVKPETLVVYTEKSKLTDPSTWVSIGEVSYDEIYLFPDPDGDEDDDGSHGLSGL